MNFALPCHIQAVPRYLKQLFSHLSLIWKKYLIDFNDKNRSSLISIGNPKTTRKNRNGIG